MPGELGERSLKKEKGLKAYYRTVHVLRIILHCGQTDPPPAALMVMWPCQRTTGATHNQAFHAL